MEENEHEKENEESGLSATAKMVTTEAEGPELAARMQHIDDDFKIVALVTLKLSGGDVKGTARKLGVSYWRLYHWSQGKGVSDYVQCQVMKECRPVGERIQAQLRGVISDLEAERKKKKSSAKDLVGMAEKLLGMSQLLNDRPTSIVETRKEDVLEKARKHLAWMLGEGAEEQQALAIMEQHAPQLYQALIESRDVVTVDIMN